MDSNFSVISLGISAGALIISLLAYLETIKARKKSARERQIMRRMDMCNQAFDLLEFNTSGMDPSAESFNKLYAIRTIIDKNLLFMKDKELNAISSQLKNVDTDYDKVSGRNLGQKYTDFEITAALYNIHDFPPKLDALYDEVKDKAIETRHFLQKAIQKIT